MRPSVRLALLCFPLSLAASFAAHAQGGAATERARPIRLVQTIGDDAGDAYLFGGIRSVQVSPTGEMYALDWKEGDIKMFSAAGRYVRTIGRRGTGPGELTGPSFRFVAHGEGLVVTDNMLRRTVTFTPAGKHVRTQSIPARNELTAPHEVYVVKDGWTVDISPPTVIKGLPDSYWRLTLRRPGNIVDTLGTIRGDMVEYTVTSGNKVISRTFGSSRLGHGGAYAIYQDTLLALIDGYMGRVQWIGFNAKGAEVRRSEVFGTATKPTTTRDFDALRRELESQWAKFASKPKVTFSSLPPRFSNATEALFASDGSLWIAAPPRSHRTRWSVFPMTGRGFAVETPDDFKLTDVRGPKLVGHALSTDSLPVIRIYEMQGR